MLYEVDVWCVIIVTGPKNEKGVYVYGGSCEYCKGVNHLAKDCPEHPKLKRAQARQNQDGDTTNFELDPQGNNDKHLLLFTLPMCARSGQLVKGAVTFWSSVGALLCVCVCVSHALLCFLFSALSLFCFICVVVIIVVLVSIHPSLTTTTGFEQKPYNGRGQQRQRGRTTTTTTTNYNNNYNSGGGGGSGHTKPNKKVVNF